MREHRERARLKFLFLQHGWTAETFLVELERRLGYNLQPAVPEEVPSNIFRDHVGVHAQKQTGLFYVGAAVLRRVLYRSQTQRARSAKAVIVPPPQTKQDAETRAKSNGDLKVKDWYFAEKELATAAGK